MSNEESGRCENCGGFHGDGPKETTVTRAQSAELHVILSEVIPALFATGATEGLVMVTKTLVNTGMAPKEALEEIGEQQDQATGTAVAALSRLASWCAHTLPLPDVAELAGDEAEAYLKEHTS